MACVLPAPEPAAKRPKLQQTLRAEQRSGRLHSNNSAATANSAGRADEQNVHNCGDLTAAADDSLSERLTAAVLRHWDNLPKTGKPQQHEHTCLAAFVVESPASDPRNQPRSNELQFRADAGPAPDSSVLTVVAIGTGMKCLSAQARCDTGRLINDSHAEAVARRTLQRWVYGQLMALVQQSRASDAACNGCKAPTQARAEVGCDFFDFTAAIAGSGPLARLRPGCRLHMWVSQAPCGDASIVDGTTNGDEELRVATHGVAGTTEAEQRSTQYCSGQRTGAKPIREPMVSSSPLRSSAPGVYINGCLEMDPI